MEHKTKNMIKVTTLKFKNIDGKEKLYVTISNDFKTVNINIGESNYNAISELIQQDAEANYKTETKTETEKNGK